jgi:Arc/MetJ-type ribon-helix-helix transcriptional regulator
VPFVLVMSDVLGWITKWATLRRVARVIHARLDDRSEADLRLLLNEGCNDSEAVRRALREAAHRRRRKSALRAEAQTAAADPSDVKEMRRVRAEMDALAAPWPDD